MSVDVGASEEMGPGEPGKCKEAKGVGPGDQCN
jgi:hypothetical protein